MQSYYSTSLVKCSLTPNSGNVTYSLPKTQSRPNHTQTPAMTSPNSGTSQNNVAGILLLLLIILAVTVPLAFLITGTGVTPTEPTSPSEPTLQAQVDALQTQVAKLASENTTQQPTDTARPPTATPQFLLDMTVNVGAANVRAGPSINHEVLGVVQKGETLRGPYSEEEGWLEVCCVDDKRGWISGELVLVTLPTSAVDLNAIATKLAAMGTLPAPTESITIDYATRTPTAPSRTPLPSPPPSLNAAPIYTKYLAAGGAHILATADVHDYKLQQASDTLLAMTSTRPDLLAAMNRTGFKIIIFNHRTQSLSQLPEFADWPLATVKAGGFAYNSAGYTVAAPADDLYCNSILVHEIAHAIDHAIQPSASWFSEKRDSAYQKAMEAGIWKGEYAATDKHEYFAVAVERHFRLQAGQTPIGLKDPTIAQLVFGVFGDAKLPSCPPTR